MTALYPPRLHWLDPRNPQEPFPPVEQALSDPNGLLAIGGDLSIHRLLQAYQKGIFPWFNPDEPILWWAPDPRAVFIPEDIHISRSLNKALRREDYAVSLDRAFASVIRACSEQRKEGTWLGGNMQLAYLELYRRGHAHSVEVWRAGDLVGGLYGVAIGRIFFGESMFSRADNASKLGLVWLCRQLAAWGFPLVDCQVASPHLETLGARQLPRAQFQACLRQHGDLADHVPGSWRFDLQVPDGADHRPRANRDATASPP